MSDAERFDGLLMNMAQSQHGIEPMLESVFSFLRRKTDFFTGASPQMIEETVLKSVRKQMSLAERDTYKKKEEMEEKRKQKEKMKEQINVKQQKQDVKAEKVEKDAPRFEDITDSDEANTKNVKEPEPDKVTEGPDDDDDNGPPLVGNGGQTDKYVWTQTLQEAQVNFPVPNGTKARDILVDIRKSTLKVMLKSSKQVLVDGKLHKSVIVDDSFWTVEDNNRICIYLQKENQMEWWSTIMEGDPEIDTKKVSPENSKLSDLDRDTRQTVEKMMYDQRQKQLGLPTSEEQQKNELLQKFMKQHPEMDFSNAKIN